MDPLLVILFVVLPTLYLLSLLVGFGMRGCAAGVISVSVIYVILFVALGFTMLDSWDQLRPSTLFERHMDEVMGATVIAFLLSKVA